MRSLLAVAEVTEKVATINWPQVQVYIVLATIFTLLGIVLTVIGYKVFDWLTPGSMQKEIFENKNVAVAILAGAVVLGICNIIASSFH